MATLPCPLGIKCLHRTYIFGCGSAALCCAFRNLTQRTRRNATEGTESLMENESDRRCREWICFSVPIAVAVFARLAHCGLRVSRAAVSGFIVARSACQRKVEMSGFLPDRNVLFQGFLQG